MEQNQKKQNNEVSMQQENPNNEKQEEIQKFFRIKNDSSFNQENQHIQLQQNESQQINQKKIEQDDEQLLKFDLDQNQKFKSYSNMNERYDKINSSNEEAKSNISPYQNNQNQIFYNIDIDPIKNDDTKSENEKQKYISEQTQKQIQQNKGQQKDEQIININTENNQNLDKNKYSLNQKNKLDQLNKKQKINLQSENDIESVESIVKNSNQNKQQQFLEHIQNNEQNKDVCHKIPNVSNMKNFIKSEWQLLQEKEDKIINDLVKMNLDEEKLKQLIAQNQLSIITLPIDEAKKKLLKLYFSSKNMVLQRIKKNQLKGEKKKLQQQNLQEQLASQNSNKIHNFMEIVANMMQKVFKKNDYTLFLDKNNDQPQNNNLKSQAQHQYLQSQSSNINSISDSYLNIYNQKNDKKQSLGQNINLNNNKNLFVQNNSNISFNSSDNFQKSFQARNISPVQPQNNKNINQTHENQKINSLKFVPGSKRKKTIIKISPQQKNPKNLLNKNPQVNNFQLILQNLDSHETEQIEEQKIYQQVNLKPSFIQEEKQEKQEKTEEKQEQENQQEFKAISLKNNKVKSEDLGENHVIKEEPFSDLEKSIVNQTENVVCQTDNQKLNQEKEYNLNQNLKQNLLQQEKKPEILKLSNYRSCFNSFSEQSQSQNNGDFSNQKLRTTVGFVKFEKNQKKNSKQNNFPDFQNEEFNHIASQNPGECQSQMPYPYSNFSSHQTINQKKQQIYKRIKQVTQLIRKNKRQKTILGLIQEQKRNFEDLNELNQSIISESPDKSDKKKSIILNHNQIKDLQQQYKKSSFAPFSNKSSSQQEKAQNTKKLEQQTIIQISPQCQHPSYSISDIKEYLSYCIIFRKISVIPCPAQDCEVIVNDNIIKKYTTPEVLQEYKQLQHEHQEKKLKLKKLKQKQKLLKKLELKKFKEEEKKNMEEFQKKNWIDKLTTKLKPQDNQNLILHDSAFKSKNMSPSKTKNKRLQHQKEKKIDRMAQSQQQSYSSNFKKTQFNQNKLRSLKIRKINSLDQIDENNNDEEIMNKSSFILKKNVTQKQNQNDEQKSNSTFESQELNENNEIMNQLRMNCPNCKSLMKKLATSNQQICSNCQQPICWQCKKLILNKETHFEGLSGCNLFDNQTNFVRVNQFVQENIEEDSYKDDETKEYLKKILSENIIFLLFKYIFTFTVFDIHRRVLNYRCSLYQSQEQQNKIFSKQALQMLNITQQQTQNTTYNNECDNDENQQYNQQQNQNEQLVQNNDDAANYSYCRLFCELVLGQGLGLLKQYKTNIINKISGKNVNGSFLEQDGEYFEFEDEMNFDDDSNMSYEIEIESYEGESEQIQSEIPI
ncbi:hypothetical protein PPERSA_03802 [Pseudocohnilembus persalinus]|uniref:Uncharacterized protein n=1 Tax=Pseudocohnilembus persalinus TaxID=266149 RepID=A0A0V0QTZ0_PSEPJ|nr:hypothetical protein PPERSA_03802 [Pseudocohnilembus persalinus]|eukprot:KRX05865.1 hypothetical protein PPERSA_03802 [Pseudocohnilembus persalinus]